MAVQSIKKKLYAILIRIGIRKVKAFLKWCLSKVYPELQLLEGKNINWDYILSGQNRSKIAINAKIYKPYHINDSIVGEFTYIAPNSLISNTTIGKFCSIGPNLVCGYGIHPLDGISTSPMFYSTLKQNGISLSSTDKIQERKPIKIGNDVFIGMNVSILDGINISDGAIIGAGSVVSKDIPAYAIAFGNPIKIVRYRFNNDIINKLLDIKWWDLSFDDLKDVEKYFFDVEKFIQDRANKVKIELENEILQNKIMN